MTEMTFNRERCINQILRRISMLSDENLQKLMALDVNTPVEVNGTVEETHFITVREMTEKTRKAIDEAYASGDPVGPFDTAEEFMKALLKDL